MRKPASTRSSAGGPATSTASMAIRTTSPIPACARLGPGRFSPSPYGLPTSPAAPVCAGMGMDGCSMRTAPRSRACMLAAMTSLRFSGARIRGRARRSAPPSHSAGEPRCMRPNAAEVGHFDPNGGSTRNAFQPKALSRERHVQQMPSIALAQLTALELSPPELISVAAAAGYQQAGVRLLPVAPGATAYPLMDDPAMLRETLARMADTEVTIADLEIVMLKPDTDVAAYLPFLETGARLGAKHVLVAAYDPEESRLVETFAAFC